MSMNYATFQAVPIRSRLLCNRIAGDEWQENSELCNVLHLLCNAKDLIEFIFDFQLKISFIW